MPARSTILGSSSCGIAGDHRDLRPTSLQARPTKASKLFEGSFVTWAESGMSKAEWPFWNPQRLAATLRELAQHTDRYDIKVTKTGGSDSFRLQRPHGVEITPAAMAEAERRQDRIEVMRREIMAEIKVKADTERESW